MAVLLDTGFFLRFLNDESPLFKNVDGYFRYFLRNDIAMIISTISIAEYCVGGSFDELPIRNLQIAPFNLNHSKRTGEFAKIAFKAKKSGNLDIEKRVIIPNDTKLFSQADCINEVGYYLSSDTSSLKIYDLLKEKANLKFEFIDLNIPHSEYFGLLDL